MLAGSFRNQLRVNGDVDVALGETVSPNYFDVLGVQPFMGRGFNVGEDESATGAPVVIISYDLWQGRYNGDPAIIGRTLDLTSSTYLGLYNPWKGFTVVGVMPRGFRGIASVWEPTQFWVSFLQLAAISADDEQARLGPGRRRLDPLDFAGLPIGRLKPGITTEQARAAIAVFEAQVKGRYPSDERAWSLVLTESGVLPFVLGDESCRRLAARMGVSGMLLRSPR